MVGTWSSFHPGNKLASTSHRFVHITPPQVHDPQSSYNTIVYNAYALLNIKKKFTRNVRILMGLHKLVLIPIASITMSLIIFTSLPMQFQAPLYVAAPPSHSLCSWGRSPPMSPYMGRITGALHNVLVQFSVPNHAITNCMSRSTILH